MWWTPCTSIFTKSIATISTVCISVSCIIHNRTFAEVFAVVSCITLSTVPPSVCSKPILSHLTRLLKTTWEEFSGDSRRTTSHYPSETFSSLQYLPFRCSPRTTVPHRRQDHWRMRVENTKELIWSVNAVAVT